MKNPLCASALVALAAFAASLATAEGPRRNDGASAVSARAKATAHEVKVHQQRLGFRAPALEQLSLQSELLRHAVYRVEAAADLEASDTAVGLVEAHVARMETLLAQVVEDAQGRAGILGQLEQARARLDEVAQEVDRIVSSADPAQRASLARALRERLAAEDPRGPRHRLAGPTVLLLDPEPAPQRSRSRAVIEEGSGRIVTVPSR